MEKKKYKTIVADPPWRYGKWGKASKKEYEAMAILNPDEFDEVAQLEEDIQDKREKFFHIIDSIPNLKKFKKQAEKILFTPDEVYPTINNVTHCGVFCNR